MIRDSKQTVGRGRTSATKHRLATEIDTKQKNQNKQTKKNHFKSVGYQEDEELQR